MRHLPAAALALIKTVVTSLFLLCLFSTACFVQTSRSAVQRSFSHDAEFNLYHVKDTLDSGGEFSVFRQSKNNVDTVIDFYNQLTTAPGATFLSAFDQPLPIVTPRVDFHFEEGFDDGEQVRGEYQNPGETRRLRDLASIQMNRAFFDFNQLHADGTPIDWAHIDYDSGSVPVLLGADYRGAYKAGDTLRGDLYFKPMNFVVTGFLDRNSAVTFHGNANTYLDRRIIVPYPERLDPVQASTLEFDGILAFQMLGGTLALPTTSGPNDAIRLLASIGARTGFTAYTIIRVPEYLVQLNLMREVIQRNVRLLAVLGTLLAGALIAVLASMSYYQSTARRPRQRIQWLIGVSPKRLTQRTVNITVAEYAVSALVLSIAVHHLEYAQASAILLSLTVLSALAAADAGYHVWLLRRHVINNSAGKGRIR